MVTFYELKAAMPQGKSFDFAQLKGKVVLIVNTASKCGFTPQFEGLEKLYKDYSPRGLMVLGFPCNQFLSQDPGDDESIGGFCMKVRLLVGNPRSEALGAGKGQYFIRTFMTDGCFPELWRLIPHHGQVGRQRRACERNVQVPEA